MIAMTPQIEEQLARIRAAIDAHGVEVPWRTSRLRRIAKRAFDLALAAPASVVAVPVMGALAVAVRMTDPHGPVMFKQARIGLDGKLFTMWKFRTMRVENPDGSVRARKEVTRGDPRLTPIGALLRDWRLDELPQLLHVLLGQMSLVGPRPDIPGNLPAYSDDHLLRFAMPPGCTAWTFTRGLFENDWATRQAINVEYVRKWTVWLDLQVVFGTLLVLLRQENTSPATAEVPGQSKVQEAR
jgi:putative colanic acid biosynthesis UDP-glucose lipid carrier transferase